jgi:hypothetical protein
MRALRAPTFARSPAKKASSGKRNTKSRRCKLKLPTRCRLLLICRPCLPKMRMMARAIGPVAEGRHGRNGAS